MTELEDSFPDGAGPGPADPARRRVRRRPRARLAAHGGRLPSGLDEEAVQARDLALLVNALWGSGAEAIAINGRRLTPLTLIRNSNRPSTSTPSRWPRPTSSRRSGSRLASRTS
ncbi:MAG: DUF881 domain-containing protein [Nocardioides sp.]